MVIALVDIGYELAIEFVPGIVTRKPADHSGSTFWVNKDIVHRLDPRNPEMEAGDRRDFVATARITVTDRKLKLDHMP
jgi:hypothetical protein